jgi:hypothetical protein
MRFDGIDVGRFRELVATPNSGALPRTTPARRPLGPGTIELRDLGGVGIHGDVLLHRWQKNSTRGGPPYDVTIEAREAASSAVVRWRLRSARPMKWVVKPAAVTKSGGNAIAIETLTIAHEGMMPLA